ncbi:MAG: secondary thiamine-phosphate synthase enzyme YjbQ [bacterium]
MVLTKYIKLNTKGNIDIIDITDIVKEKLEDVKMSNGIVNIFIPGATGSLTTIEYEPGVIQDFKDIIDTIIPEAKEYQHNLRYKDGNGHSHIRASFIGPSLTIPFINNKLQLGIWQKIIFIEFDNIERQREIICQFMGEEKSNEFSPL